MNTTPTPPPGLSVISAQQQRANELAKIAKTQIVFKIGGLTEENFAYAQQEIQAVSASDLACFLVQQQQQQKKKRERERQRERKTHH
jgi:hypothetical protein